VRGRGKEGGKGGDIGKERKVGEWGERERGIQSEGERGVDLREREMRNNGREGER
jgi:hypothetical protein